MSGPYKYICTKCGGTNVIDCSNNQGSIQHCFECKAIYKAFKNPNYIPSEEKKNTKKNVLDSLPLHKKRVEKKTSNQN